MFYYQKAVEYESSKFWVRIILALGTNHLNFGYESSGYETSVGTKRPDSFLNDRRIDCHDHKSASIRKQRENECWTKISNGTPLQKRAH